MAHGLHDVARPRLALGADHRRALGDAAQRFTEVPCAADEGDVEAGLVDVVPVVRGRENLALVDVVNLDGLQNLRLRKMADAAFRHHRDGDGVLDALNHLRVAHPRHAARRADIRGDALERHDGAGARSLGDFRLLGRGDVHNHAALEHLGKIFVQFVTVFRHFIYLPCISDKKSIY